ncbi:uncharacterized protein LOC120640533 isoform X2 [Panicum virgatum]|uniref:uncharacterized protein LOC120640533 isoform X2 n=1 Tax=Panicum virgatum TaxID=38727 RepID=UPI0019D53C3F|nr:uncharacterized protein LOC120640533 isoform X2 [Panicum virgatum]
MLAHVRASLMLLCLMRWCPVGRQDYCCSLTPVATQFGCWGWRCCGEGDEPSHCMAMVRGLHFLQPARMEQSLPGREFSWLWRESSSCWNRILGPDQRWHGVGGGVVGGTRIIYTIEAWWNLSGPSIKVGDALAGMEGDGCLRRSGNLNSQKRRNSESGAGRRVNCSGGSGSTEASIDLNNSISSLPSKRQKVARPVAFCGFESESAANGLEHLHIKSQTGTVKESPCAAVEQIKSRDHGTGKGANENQEAGLVLAEVVADNAAPGRVDPWLAGCNMNHWDLNEQPAESSSTMCGVVNGGGAAIVSVDAEVSSTNQQVVGWKTRNCVSSRPDHRGKGIRENKCTGAGSYEVCRSKFRVHHQPCSGY